jgi:hypothetical protein
MNENPLDQFYIYINFFINWLWFKRKKIKIFKCILVFSKRNENQKNPYKRLNLYVTFLIFILFDETIVGFSFFCSNKCESL